MTASAETFNAPAQRTLPPPLEHRPFAFRWPVAGLSIVVVGERAKYEQRPRFTQAFQRDGAQLVVNLYTDDGTSTYHKRGTE
jgi:hypothetical protein